MSTYDQRPVVANRERACATCYSLIPRNTAYMMMERPHKSEEAPYVKCMCCHKGPYEIKHVGSDLIVLNNKTNESYPMTLNILAQAALYLINEGKQDVFIDGVRVGTLHLVEN